LSKNEMVSPPGKTVIHRTEPKISLEELFQGKSPAEWRAVYADAYDWGPDVGREVARA
jgi:hypothetical protein